MRQHSTVTGLLAAVAVLFSATSGWTCSQQSFPRQVRNDFQVEVTHNSKPVQGLGIALKTVLNSDSDAEPALIASGLTNNNGRVAFGSLKPGDYSVEVLQPALPYSIWVRVGGHDKHEKPIKVLEFEWPGDAITTREASGTIRVAQKTGNRLMDLARRPQFQFAAGANVVLADLITNKPLLSTTTDDEGRLVLDAPSLGLYVLHIERAEDQKFRGFSSETPLSLDPVANRLILDLYLREICGTMVASSGYPR